MVLVVIHTDGGARRQRRTNQLGAYAGILEFEGCTKEISGVVPGGTNNGMELKAVIESLNEMKRGDIPVYVFTDSQYVVNGFSLLEKWEKRDWKSLKGKDIQHREMWEVLLDYKKNIFAHLEIRHTYAHNGNQNNERADKLVNIAMDNYEKKNTGRVRAELH